MKILEPQGPESVCETSEIMRGLLSRYVNIILNHTPPHEFLDSCLFWMIEKWTEVSVNAP